jgi:hypothetical protein
MTYSVRQWKKMMEDMRPRAAAKWILENLIWN